MGKGDYIQQLASYVKRNLSKGYTLDSLRFALLGQGYSRSAVSRAIKIANQQLAIEVPKMKEKPVIRYEIVYDKSRGGEKQGRKKAGKKRGFWQKIMNLFR